MTLYLRAFLAIVWREIMPGDDLVVLHQGRVLAHGAVEDMIAAAGARDINSAFMRLTGAAAEPGSPAP